MVPVVRQPIGTDDAISELGGVQFEGFFVPQKTKGFTGAPDTTLQTQMQFLFPK